VILKIQMAKNPACAGFCIVLPEPVWNSWKRHLGDPALVPDPKRPLVVRLNAPHKPGPTENTLIEPEPAWIIVFKIDPASSQSPRALTVVSRISTDSTALIHYTFDAAPEAAIKEGVLDRFAGSFRKRLLAAWSPST